MAISSSSSAPQATPAVAAAGAVAPEAEDVEMTTSTSSSSDASSTADPAPAAAAVRGGRGIGKRASAASYPSSSANPGRGKGRGRSVAAPPTGSSHNSSSSNTSLGHLLGYIPERGDFATEYRNDTEQRLTTIDFRPEDTPEERELKLRVVRLYCEILDEREVRKDFVLSRGLLDPASSWAPPAASTSISSPSAAAAASLFDNNEHMDKSSISASLARSTPVTAQLTGRKRKRTRKERDLRRLMRRYARFQTPEEHEKFILGLLEEYRLRQRVWTLQKLRLSGVTSLQAFQLEEELRRKRTRGSRKRASVSSSTATRYSYNYPKPGSDGSSRAGRREMDEEDADDPADEDYQGDTAMMKDEDDDDDGGDDDGEARPITAAGAAAQHNGPFLKQEQGGGPGMAGQQGNGTKERHHVNWFAPHALVQMEELRNAERTAAAALGLLEEEMALCWELQLPVNSYVALKNQVLNKVAQIVSPEQSRELVEIGEPP